MAIEMMNLSSNVLMDGGTFMGTNKFDEADAVDEFKYHIDELTGVLEPESSVVSCHRDLYGINVGQPKYADHELRDDIETEYSEPQIVLQSPVVQNDGDDEMKPSKEGEIY
jgi:hypothetical protein